MENQRNNKGIIALLIVIIVMLAAFCVLLATGIISLKTNTSDNGNNVIQTKLVDNLNNGNSETTFNGITVKVKQDIEDMMCVSDSIMINGNDVTKDNGMCIESYEFYDDNVIIMSYDTGGTVFTIYNVNSKSTILKYSGSEGMLNGYFVKSYSINDNVIRINAYGCGVQCGSQNSGEQAIFEIEYSNKIFTEPKLINKLNS